MKIQTYINGYITYESKFKDMITDLFSVLWQKYETFWNESPQLFYAEPCKKKKFKRFYTSVLTEHAVALRRGRLWILSWLGSRVSAVGFCLSDVPVDVQVRSQNYSMFLDKRKHSNKNSTDDTFKIGCYIQCCLKVCEYFTVLNIP